MYGTCLVSQNAEQSPIPDYKRPSHYGNVQVHKVPSPVSFCIDISVQCTPTKLMPCVPFDLFRATLCCFASSRSVRSFPARCIFTCAPTAPHSLYDAPCILNFCSNAYITRSLHQASLQLAQPKPEPFFITFNPPSSPLLSPSTEQALAFFFSFAKHTAHSFPQTP